MDLFTTISMKRLLVILFIFGSLYSTGQSAKRLLLSGALPKYFSVGDTTTTSLIGAAGINLKYPSVVYVGDDLYMIACSDLGGTFNAVSGWTLIGENHDGENNNGSYAIYHKTATGTEDGTTQYVTITYSGGLLFGLITSFKNAGNVIEESFFPTALTTGSLRSQISLYDKELLVEGFIFFSPDYNPSTVSVSTDMTINVDKTFIRGTRKAKIELHTSKYDSYVNSFNISNYIPVYFGNFKFKLVK